MPIFIVKAYFFLRKLIKWWNVFCLLVLFVTAVLWILYQGTDFGYQVRSAFQQFTGWFVIEGFYLAWYKWNTRPKPKRKKNNP